MHPLFIFWGLWAVLLIVAIIFWLKVNKATMNYQKTLKDCVEGQAKIQKLVDELVDKIEEG